MDNGIASLLAVGLVGAGVSADAWLLWMAARAWREDRSKRRQPSLRAGRGASCGRTFVLAGATAGLFGSAAYAQTPIAVQPATEPAVAAAASPLVISTDRPSFSDGTGIVQLGHFQLETGYTYTHRDRSGVESDRQNGPEMLGRVAIIDDRLEFRVSWSGYVDTTTKTGGVQTHADGWSDVTLGVKLKLFDQAQLAAWAPRIAVEAQSTIGAGGQEVSTQEEEPALKFLWSYDLGTSWGEKYSGWTVGGNLNIAWPTSGEGTAHFEQLQASIYVNAPLFDKCTAFAEYYALCPNTDGGDAAHYADIGAVYLLNNRVQLDARVGFGLNSEADNFFAGVGISFLF